MALAAGCLSMAMLLYRSLQSNSRLAARLAEREEQLADVVSGWQPGLGWATGGWGQGPPVGGSAAPSVSGSLWYSHFCAGRREVVCFAGRGEGGEGGAKASGQHAWRCGGG